MSLLRKLAGETAIYGLSSILGRLINYVILAYYLSRVFDPVEYGVVGDMYATSAILLVFFTYRMETAFFRFGKDKDEIKRVFSTISICIFFTSILLVLLLFLFSEPIATYLKHPGKGNYFRMFAIILGADALAAIPFARLRLINKPMVFAVIKILNVLISVLFILFFLSVVPYFINLGWPLEWMYDAEDRIKYVFMANMIASIAVLLMLLPSYFNLKLSLDVQLLKKMLIYASPLIIAQLAGAINLNIGFYFIKNFATEDLDYNKYLEGVYNAAVKIPVLMTLFTQAFNYAAEPFFFRNADRTDAKAIYSQVAQAFTLVGALTFLGIMLYIDIVQLIVGREVRGGMGIVPIFLMAYLFLGLYYNFSIWYKLRDRTIVGGYIAIIGSLITLILNAILVPRITIYGPAWAALCCFVFMAGAAYWTGQKQYKIDYPIRKMLMYVLIALSGYFFSEWGRLFWGDNLISTFIANTIFLALALVPIYYVDRQLMDSIFRGVLQVLNRKKEPVPPVVISPEENPVAEDTPTKGDEEEEEE